MARTPGLSDREKARSAKARAEHARRYVANTLLDLGRMETQLVEMAERLRTRLEWCEKEMEQIIQVTKPGADT